MGQSDCLVDRRFPGVIGAKDQREASAQLTNDWYVSGRTVPHNFYALEMHMSPVLSTDRSCDGDVVRVAPTLCRMGKGGVDVAEVGLAVAGVEGEVVGVVYSRTGVGVGALR